MRNRSVPYLREATFQALADPTRRAVLDLLRLGAQPAGQIAAAFPVSRPAISKHLRQLRKARLVVESRSGRHRVYQLNAAPLQAVDAWLEQYRRFWQVSLGNLKSFVEREYARESGELSAKGYRKRKQIQEECMKLGKVALALTTLIVVLSANLVLADSEAHKSFDLLKGMEGNWAGKNQQGNPIQVSFRMTAGGSALMSEIHGRGPENMITMFHMDGDRLVMTHYCGAGNQPRMKVTASDAKSVSFEFFDGTNIGPGDGHMQHVTFTEPDANHHVEEWVFLDHGKEMKELFTLERVKE